MMNCVQCQERLTEYLEGLLEPQDQEHVGRHLDSCVACQTAVAEQRQLEERLAANAHALAPLPLEDAVMNQILKEQTSKLRRTAMTKRYGTVGLGMAAAAAALAVVLLVPWGGTHNGQATAAEVMKQAATAVAHLNSVHIELNARTRPYDNFEAIDLDADFVPHELWKTFGQTPRWRVEKPGRVVIFDGKTSFLEIKGKDATGGRSVVNRFDGDNNLVYWMKPLMDVDQVLNSELALAEQMDWDVKLTKETGSDGRLKWVVTVEAKAQGPYDNDWLRDTSIPDSDNRRVYRFDAGSERLEDLQVWVHQDGHADALVLEITTIEYDPDLAADLFDITVPEGAILVSEPKVQPDNDKYARMAPNEAARAFFQALSDENWDEALKFASVDEFPKTMKEAFAGLEIIDIGEPFQSGQHLQWFVPYEIRFSSGQIKKHNLALRNDNAAGRWQVDGGF